MSASDELKKSLAIVGSSRAKSTETRVSREFLKQFDLVARHYRLAELGELEEAKAAARGDMESAEKCFAALAAEIRA